MTDHTIPEALLRAARIPAPPEEISEICRFYDSLREQVEILFQVDVEQDGPAPMFSASMPTPTVGAGQS